MRVETEEASGEDVHLPRKLCQLVCILIECAQSNQRLPNSAAGSVFLCVCPLPLRCPFFSPSLLPN